MPLAPLEAAGCGLPLVISDIPGHSFLKDMSFQFTLDNIQQAAQEAQALINRILSGDERYQHYLWEKSEAIRTRFSVARMATQYALLYARSTD
jgi:glycosyltransferase involved in cell wall biosynthesis